MSETLTTLGGEKLYQSTTDINLDKELTDIYSINDLLTSETTRVIF
jgi:hypothetical protein